VCVCVCARVCVHVCTCVCACVQHIDNNCGQQSTVRTPGVWEILSKVMFITADTEVDTQGK